MDYALKVAPLRALMTATGTRTLSTPLEWITDALVAFESIKQERQPKTMQNWWLSLKNAQVKKEQESPNTHPETHLMMWSALMLLFLTALLLHQEVCRVINPKHELNKPHAPDCDPQPCETIDQKELANPTPTL